MYPIIQDYILNDKKSSFLNLKEYLKVVNDRQLSRLITAINKSYTSEGSGNNTQQVLLFYSIIYNLETGETDVKLDGEMKWLFQLDTISNLEKLRRLGLMKDYHATLTSSEIIFEGMIERDKIEDMLMKHFGEN